MDDDNSIDSFSSKAYSVQSLKFNVSLNIFPMDQTHPLINDFYLVFFLNICIVSSISLLFDFIVMLIDWNYYYSPAHGFQVYF